MTTAPPASIVSRPWEPRGDRLRLVDRHDVAAVDRHRRRAESLRREASTVTTIPLVTSREDGPAGRRRLPHPRHGRQRREEQGEGADHEATILSESPAFPPAGGRGIKV
jgi:hypothetical protein